MSVKDIKGRPPEDEENLGWPEDHDEEEEEAPSHVADDEEEVEIDREEKELDWVISQEKAEDDLV